MVSSVPVDTSGTLWEVIVVTGDSENDCVTSVWVGAVVATVNVSFETWVSGDTASICDNDYDGAVESPEWSGSRLPGTPA